ncbi:hypothetical protein ACIGCM_01320 [Pseudomonas sp. NPDC078700]|uniref:hypothetical protein n=1 Tax=Pseudomonas sp. NPDC078700 TaxID=3364424 RepID=UPI0037C5F235
MQKDFLFKKPAPAKATPASKPAKAKPIKPAVQPRTASANKTMSPQDYAVIQSALGTAEANRIKSEYEGSKPEAVQHLVDIAAPALAQLNQLPPEYLLVGELIGHEKSKREQLEASIASWYLTQVTGGAK